MTISKIGYSLVDGTTEVRSWTGLPAETKLPNEDYVYCPQPGLLGAVADEEHPERKQYLLCERFMDDPGPATQFHSRTGETVSFDGTRVVVTVSYSSVEDIVPTTVTPLQVRLALRQAGLREQVDAYVATLSPDAQDKWEYATIIERHDPTLLAGTAALGMNSSQVDDLFRLASTLL